MQEETPLRILIVDDNPQDRASYRRFLQRTGAYLFAECENGEEGLRDYFRNPPDCVLLDYRLPDIDGMEFLARANAGSNDLHAVVVLTSQGNEVVAVNALKMGAQDYLGKDTLSAENLYRAVRNAIEKVVLRRDLHARTAALESANAELHAIKESLKTEVENRTAELRVANETERRLRKEAEQANRMKDEFLALLSHELRTPLTAILGWLSVLQTGRLDAATQAKALDSITRNARVQSRLNDDLLDISGIVTGKFGVSLEPIDLVEIVNAAVEVARSPADAKHITIVSEISQAPVRISGDAARLQQAILNVLSNAIKFTNSDGVVTVSLRQTDERAVIQVQDTGIGIAREFLPFVFERFRQADASITRGYGGLGLGLAIVNHIVALHHGTARANSRGVGEGATIILEFPLEKAGSANEVERAS